MSIVYLAGPITGLSYGGCTDWRESVKEELADVGITAMSPMRGKTYLLNETNIGDSYEETLLSSQRAIVARDYFDVQRADILLVNLAGAQRVSIGTVMEIAWAYPSHKPVVLVMPKNDLFHDHSFIRELCAYRVDSLDEGVHIVKNILLP